MIQAKIENAIPKDKLLHFCVGLLLSLLMIFSYWFILLPISIGVLKECIDKYIRKTAFEINDILATWLGIVPVLVILSIEKYIA